MSGQSETRHQEDTMSPTATITIGWTHMRQRPGIGFPMLDGYAEGMSQATATVEVPIPPLRESDSPIDVLHVIAEAVFEGTNIYAGPVWEAIEPHLPEWDHGYADRANAAEDVGAFAPVLDGHRDHTALSVGDTVTFEGITLAVASFGFDQV
jgi:hypothetical protein